MGLAAMIKGFLVQCGSMYKFNGFDPDSWIFAINGYFSLLETTPAQRLRIIVFHLEGDAAEWYCWMTRNKLVTSWEGFLKSVRNQFGPSKYEDPQGARSKLLQTCTVAQYQSEFEKLMNWVTDVSESLLIPFYISGLSSEDQWPTSAISKTHDNITVVLTNNPTPSQVLQIQATPPLLPTPTKSTTNTNTTSLAIKWISQEERQERLNKGLCFNCDSKWMRGHKCLGKFPLHMMEEDDNRGREIRAAPANYLKDKVNFEGEGNVTIEDKGEDEPRGSRLPQLGRRIS
nr:hypothetical protein [Tanacetum cinerariifolium]